MKTTIIFILLTMTSLAQDTGNNSYSATRLLKYDTAKYIYTVFWCTHKEKDETYIPQYKVYPYRLIPNLGATEDTINFTRLAECECGYSNQFTIRKDAFDFYNKLLVRQNNRDIDSSLYGQWIYNVKIDSGEVWRSFGIMDSLVLGQRLGSIMVMSIKPIPDTLIAQRNCLTLKSFLDLWDEYKKECTAERRFEKLKRNSVWLPPYSKHWKQWLKKEPNIYEFIDKFLRKKVTYH